MSCWPTVVPLLTTRCLYWVGYWGGWCGCRGHQGCQGLHLKMKTVYCKVLLKIQDGLLNTEDNRTWSEVNGTQVITTIAHQMPLCGGTSELRSTGPNLVPLLATRCLCLYWGVTSELRSAGPNLVPLLAARCFYWGYIWPKVSLTQRPTKCQADLR